MNINPATNEKIITNTKINDTTLIVFLLKVTTSLIIIINYNLKVNKIFFTFVFLKLYENLVIILFFSNIFN